MHRGVRMHRRVSEVLRHLPMPRIVKTVVLYAVSFTIVSGRLVSSTCSQSTGSILLTLRKQSVAVQQVSTSYLKHSTCSHPKGKGFLP